MAFRIYATSENIESGPSIFDLEESLFSITPKQREQQYAGYILLHLHRDHPALVTPLLPKLIELLDEAHKQTRHISIPRQVFSVFQDRAVPEELAGLLFERAVGFFLDTSEPIAGRARALEAAANVASQHDGLWEEIAELTTLVGPEESAGVKSIAKRMGQLAAKKLAKG